MKHKPPTKRNAFLRGMLSLFCPWLSWSHEETRRILNTSDADAVRSDWQAVGDDLRAAMRQFEREMKD